MDTIKAIFLQLGVDSSFLPQFFVVIVVFILARFLFLNHLQFILENREEKTVKLESSAEETFDRIQKLTTEYKNKIDGSQKEILHNMTIKKNDLVKRLTENFKKTEKEVGQFVENSKQKLEADAHSQKDMLTKDIESLSQDLLNKVLN